MKTNILLLVSILIVSIGCSQNKKNLDNFFEKIKSERVDSDSLIIWNNFGPGMSGYNEEFWTHPTDTNTMFMGGPDMHVSYGTWDAGKSWHTIKDFDGNGLDMERVHDIVFSRQNPTLVLQ